MKCIQVWSDVKGQFFSKSFFTNDKEEIKKLFKLYNIEKKLAIGYTINDCPEGVRKKEKIPFCNHLFIDLDFKEKKLIHEYNKVIEFLNKIGLKIHYTLDSLNGYHILVKTKYEDENISKQFLKYLYLNVSTYVDLITWDKSRICRFPESYNYKNSEDKPFKSSYLINNTGNTLTKEEIENNNKIIYSYYEIQNNLNIENEKQIKPKNEFEENIEKATKGFLYEILVNEEIQNYLKSKRGISKNDILFKNLAVFVRHNPEHQELAYEFIEKMDHNKSEFTGWITNKEISTINYNELDKWKTEHNLNLEITRPKLASKLENDEILKNYFIYKISTDSEKYYLIDKKLDIKTIHSSLGIKEYLYQELKKKNFDFSIYMNTNQSLQNYLKQTDIAQSITKQLIQLNCKSYVSELYFPIPKLVVEKDKGEYINTFKESKILSNIFKENNILEPENYIDKFSHIKKLILHLCEYDEKGFDYICEWLSYIIKNPLDKLPTSIIFKGTYGTGKTTLMLMVIEKIFGEQNVNIPNNKTLEKGWGSFMKNVRFVCCEETKIFKGTESFNTIKDYSTNKKITIEEKNKNPEKIDNYSHWFYFTNDENPMPIIRGDRRFSVFSQEEKIEVDLYKKITEEEVINFTKYLLSIEVNKNKVTIPYSNRTRQEQMETNFNYIETFLIELYNFQSLPKFLENINSLLINIINIEEDVVSNKNLYSIYKEWGSHNNIHKIKNERGFSFYLTSKLNIKNIKMKNNLNGKSLKHILRVAQRISLGEL